MNSIHAALKVMSLQYVKECKKKKVASFCYL